MTFKIKKGNYRNGTRQYFKSNFACFNELIKLNKLGLADLMYYVKFKKRNKLSFNNKGQKSAMIYRTEAMSSIW